MRSAWKCGWVILILTTGLMTAGLAGCAPAETPGGTAAVAASAATSAASSAEAVAEIERRYQKILERSGAYGEGGRLVLTVARDALLRGKAEGKWPDVGLEDLWAHAIKEGRGLFNDPARRWGKTGPEETKDLIGQTTIGPWQITVQNVKNIYGPPYGISKDWSDAEVYTFCRDHPEVQASMICDYIQLSYTDYGRRGPYAIQRYFWLEGFVRGWIGQGSWEKSVLATPPDGDWRKLTPEMKADTGFYAKQLFCGHPHNTHGMLYWLWVTGDTEAILDALRRWRDEPKRVWDEAAEKAVATGETGGFAIQPEDLRFIEDAEARAALERLAAQVLAEPRPAVK